MAVHISCLVKIVLITSVVSIKCLKQPYGNYLPKFFGDFVKHQQIPTQVVLFSCYSISDETKLIRHLNVPVRVQQFHELNILSQDKNNLILFIIDLHCSRADHFLKQVVNAKFFKNSFRWLFVTKSTSFELDIEIFPDSRVVMASPTNGGSTFLLNYVYRVDKNSPIILDPYGYWSLSSGLTFTTNESSLLRKRQNLNGKELKITLVITNKDSLNCLDDSRGTEYDSVTKVNYIITEHLMDCLNTSGKYLTVNSWGYRNISTDEWDGVMKHMANKMADIGCSLFITEDRLPHVEYLSLVSPTRVQFIFREPPLSFVSNIYFLPFSKLVWICSLGLVVSSVGIICLTMKTQRIRINETGMNYPTRMSDFILLGIGAICQIGFPMEARITSARISTLILTLAMVFLFTAYTANIVALLQTTTKDIRTLSDLLNSKLELGIEDMPYNRYYFQVATDPIKKAIYEKKVLMSPGKPRIMSLQEGIARVRRDFFAFNVEVGKSYKLIKDTFFEHEKCNLRTIQYLDVNDPWYAVPKGSPYKELIKINLFRIREFGLQMRVKNKFYTGKPVCMTGPSFESVRLIDCYTAFKILLVGYAVSVFVLILEKLFPLNSLWLQ